MNSILNNIDFIARFPGGVTLLRKLVFELAVRGKLVSQDPQDEPASVLLERIKREKARLMKEGKIKAGRELPEIKEDEKPYELSKGWEWARLGNLSPFGIFDGDWIESKDQDINGKIKLIQLADIQENLYQEKSNRYVNEGTFYRLCCSEVIKNDILIARLPNPIGRACVFPGSNNRCITAVDIAILRSCGHIDNRLLSLFINSPTARDQIVAFGKGATRFRVSTGDLKTVLLPLPPLPEQSRIVACVQELMAVLDRLEDQTNKTEQERNRALIGATQALSQAVAPEEIASSWLRLATDLNRLVDRTEDVKTIRAMILELAIRGKLVPQDHKDEPASVLLERIKQKKTRLVKEGKIKAGKELLEIKKEVKPYELPRGWVWIRFSSTGDCRLGKMLDEQKNAGKLVPYLRNSNVQWGHFDLYDVKQIRLSSKELIEYQILKNDLLICEGGEPGRCAIWENDDGYITFQKALHRYRPYKFANVRYIEILLKKLAFTGELDTFFTGATIKHLTGQSLDRILIPLPPSAEQSRIVLRFQEISALLDRLEEKLTVRDKVATLASESIVKKNQA